jgi:hypothetical protein
MIIEHHASGGGGDWGGVWCVYSVVVVGVWPCCVCVWGGF